MRRRNIVVYITVLAEPYCRTLAASNVPSKIDP
ncbi:protein of unknown function (plasmid) [Caballeronia sp. S22]